MNKMKRKPIIAGNWKMYKSRDEALSFLYAVNLDLPPIEFVETLIFSPSLYLRSLVKREGEDLKIGAQNMSQFEEGAYTGEISAPMLKNVGIKHILVGHSERRAYFNETDEHVNEKIKMALKYDLQAIVCVGESLETREKNETNAFLKKQILGALNGLVEEEVEKLVIAYEPIWAIGTGKTATSKQANDAIVYIRKTIEGLYNKDLASKVRILYGGSVNTSNIDELLSQSDIDGALIGGASLDPKSFLYLAHAAFHRNQK